MKQVGNDKQQIATASSNLTERDVKAVQLRYLGKSSREIAEATSWNESHVRRLFMKGGRLEAAYEAYAHKQQGIAQAKAESILERAKQEAQSAIERMVELSKDPGNGPVCYKANEYLLGLAGASTEASLRGLLQKLSFEEAKKRINETFEELYGRTLESGDITEDLYQQIISIIVNANVPRIIESAEAEVKRTLKAYGFDDEANAYRFPKQFVWWGPEISS